MKRQKVRKTLLLISMLIFPITLNYFSPYLIVQGSFEGILSGSGMLFLSMLFTSLILGRSFCGWLCPAGAIGEVCATIQDKPVGKRLRFMKYCIWVPWLSAIVFGFVHAGGLNNIDLVYYTDGGISVNAPAGYIIYFSVIALVVVLALTVGRRSFCHGVCWMAPFMVIGTFMRDKLHLPGLRLTARPEACIDCKACNRVCPMSLDVNGMVNKHDMRNSECILCASCADACPKGVLNVRFVADQPRPVGEEAVARES